MIAESDPAPGFPARAGVVDMGSNAIRLLAVEFIAPRTWTELFSERVPARLGHGVYQTGRLDPRTMEVATQTMVRFRDVLEELEITRYRAVATSAVRESENGAELLQAVHRASGLTLERISGAEEARLVNLAVRDRLELGDEPWVIADLGGGSLEVALVNGSGMLVSASHTIGSVRLLEEFEETGDADRFQKLVDEHLGGFRLAAFSHWPDPIGFAATGGNMEDLATLAGAKRDEQGVGALPIAALRRVIRAIGRLTYEERVSRLGLRPDRADVILPAAMVYARLADLLKVDTIRVPYVGLKEGVLLDLIDDMIAHSGYAMRHAREVYAGAVALGRRFAFDEQHATQVARLAENLFDQTVPVHELDEDARELLVAAAVLHDIGQSISYSKHHKHSYYLISQSELPGVSVEEIEIVAHVARYHRKAHPSSKHESFTALPEEAQALVTKLAAILRLADALDRDHSRKVDAVEAIVGEGSLDLRLTAKSDTTLERWAISRKAGLFEEVFGLDVTVDGRSDEHE